MNLFAPFKRLLSAFMNGACGSSRPEPPPNVAYILGKSGELWCALAPQIDVCGQGPTSDAALESLNRTLKGYEHLGYTVKDLLKEADEHHRPGVRAGYFLPDGWENLFSIEGLTIEQEKAVDRLIEFFRNTNKDVIDTGCPIHDAFGLTYASYHVVPRSLLQEMPMEWKLKFVDLMEEFDEEFPSYAEVTYNPIERVHPRYAGWSPAALDEEFGEDGGPPTIPDPLSNYRHPDWDEIDRMRKASNV